MIRGVNMYKSQEKAINLARTVLFNEFSYSLSKITPEDMHVVWLSKTLQNQNWQALVSGVYVKEYIKVTYNGDRQEAYVGVYQRVCDECIKDGDDVLDD